EPLQDPVGFRNQRFADMEPRKTFALEKFDAIAMLCNQRGSCAPGGTTADDDDVGGSAVVHGLQLLLFLMLPFVHRQGLPSTSCGNLAARSNATSFCRSFDGRCPSCR